MNTTLVVMAAGIGSRFGGGVKQLTPVGPGGELIIDYSVYDAMKAGFDKVIFIIREDIEKDFRHIIGDRISKVIDLEYAFQRKDDLPAGFTAPAARQKPWGTGQAVLSVRDMVKDPFCVINADDFYGREGFKAVHDYMTDEMRTGGEKLDMCMAGFVLENTLSDNGGVTRGVCRLSGDGRTLEKVTETFEIIRLPDGTMKAQDEKGDPVKVTQDMFVSMNMWGFPPAFIDRLRDGFPAFLSSLREGDIKSEYLLPSVVDECVQSGTGRVTVLPSRDRWFGVTYAEDRQVVIDSIKALVDSGTYPESLYG